MDEDNYIGIKNNNLNRWLVGSRSYWYVYRKREDDHHTCFYKDSKLLGELLEIYRLLPKEEKNSFVNKTSQKAE